MGAAGGGLVRGGRAPPAVAGREGARAAVGKLRRRPRFVFSAVKRTTGDDRVPPGRGWLWWGVHRHKTDKVNDNSTPPGPFAAPGPALALVQPAPPPSPPAKMEPCPEVPLARVQRGQGLLGLAPFPSFLGKTEERARLRDKAQERRAREVLFREAQISLKYQMRQG